MLIKKTQLNLPNSLGLEWARCFLLHNQSHYGPYAGAGYRALPSEVHMSYGQSNT